MAVDIVRKCLKIVLLVTCFFPQTVVSEYKDNDGLLLAQSFIQDIYKTTNVLRNYDQTGEQNTNLETNTEQNILLSAFLMLSKQVIGNANMSSTCAHDTERLLRSLFQGSSWAFQFFDATGKPGPSITRGWLDFSGNYDQCRDAIAPPQSNQSRDGFGGNYCVVPFRLRQNHILKVKFGACLPSTCSAEDITTFSREILLAVNITTFESEPTQCLSAPTEVTTATVFAIIILSIAGCLAITGTIYDFLIQQGETSHSTKHMETDKNHDSGPAQLASLTKHLEANGINENGQEQIVSPTKHMETEINYTNEHDQTHISPRHIETNGIYVNGQDQTASSIKHMEANGNATNGNGPEIVTVEETTPLISKTVSKDRRTKTPVAIKIILAFSLYTNGRKVLDATQRPGSLGALHGIRFLSMSWVVLGHTYLFITNQAINYTEQADKFYHRWTFDAIANALLSVDTFFAMSGLLTSYLTIKELKKRGLHIGWPLFYFHRFWRLTPPYMFAIVIVLGLQQYLGQGPFWMNEQPMDKTSCEDNWWTNLLYINNFVNDDKMCFAHSWYLANDMQFFVVSPLLLIPFYFHRMAGIASCLLFLLASWITTGVMSSQNDWPPNLNLFSSQMGDWFLDYYIKPYCRIGPYVIGVLTGYFLTITDGRPFRMKWWIVTSGWVVSIASALALLYGIHGDITSDDPSSTSVIALYNAVSRTVWGACVCWVVIACTAGYGGPVNALLSWSPFVVLGRLTYSTYLIHLSILNIFTSNLGTHFYANDPMMVVLFLGLLVFCNMAAFVFMLLLESPMVALEKIMIPKKKKS